MRGIHIKILAKTKISYLNMPILNKDICKTQIPVNNIPVVNVIR